jgi:hypothetical protein
MLPPGRVMSEYSSDFGYGFLDDRGGVGADGGGGTHAELATGEVLLEAPMEEVSRYRPWTSAWLMTLVMASCMEP